MAVMSTQPSDYPVVASLATAHQQDQTMCVVPAFGVHPWWLHELGDKDWETVQPNQPRWIHNLEQALIQHPGAAVGETGLDGFHFDPTTHELTCPMSTQVTAFRLQLELAAELDRPVSIHCVRSFGPLLETLSSLKRLRKLPRRVYFHAFGGKEGTVDQLVSICEEVFFGFAPVVNFRSPKTSRVVQKVGLERLVLETDHEDAKFVAESMESSLSFLSDVLGIVEQTLVECTTANALRFYGLEASSG